MDVLDRLRLRQDQEVVVAAQIAVKILVALAAKRRLVIFQRLDHGAHGAVEHQDALAREVEEGGSLRRKLAKSYDQAAFCAFCGRMPSRWLIAKTRSARFMV